jgi:DNA polymerase (family 10)
MPGMGEKKIEQLRASLAFVESTGRRVRLGEASELAGELLAGVRKSDGANRVEVAGSLRRGRETIGDIDLLCEAKEADAAAIIEAFAQAPRVKRVLAKGQTKGSVVVTGDIQVDLRVVEAKSFGAAWCYLTGSKAHNVRLREIAIGQKMKLNEYGLFDGDKSVAGVTEEEIYKALGLAFVPPEMREDAGEIQAAAAGKLPKLVSLADIKGDMHMHTTASDGLNTIDEMIDAARARGYKYLAITDHSKTQRQAGGLDEARVLKHAKQVRAAARKHPDMLVLAGAEVDLLKDGTLDFAREVCLQLDFVIASCHEGLKMEKEPATRRIVKAIESGCVHCIGHPSGRLINERPGMELDIDKIAQAAAANGVALEINAHPHRLDLRDTHVRAAVAAGAKIIISTDAHSIAGLELMRFGVATARRGWATCEDVVNTWSTAKLKAWLAK